MSDFLSTREALYARLEQADFSQRRVCREERMGRNRLRNAIAKYPGLEELVRKKAEEASKATKEPTLPPWEHAAWRVKEDELKRQLQRERSINRELAINSSVVKATAAVVIPWMSEHMRLPEIKAPKKPDPDMKPIWLLVSVNDNHFGATFDLSIMGQLNSFSPNICALRIERLCDVIRAWVDGYAKIGNPVAGIVIAFNGDNFNGNLPHEDSNNYGRVVQQAGDIAAIHAQFVWEIAHIVPEVLCVCPAADNHTRSTKRSLNSGAAAHTSWSTLYYWAMKAMLRSVKNVTFHIDKDRQVFIRICGWTWGITHGDLIKGGGGSLGFPAYGLSRHHNASIAETVVLAKRIQKDVALSGDTVEEKLERLMAAVEGIVDHSLVAHFHTHISPVPGLHVAPSLMGPDPFAKDNLRKAAQSPAAQVFWAIHPEHDIIGEHVVRLQGIIKERPSRYFWGVLDDDLKAPDDFFFDFIEQQRAS